MIEFPYDFHMHTVFSDGDNSILEMIETCVERGIKHMAITDHITSEGFFTHTFQAPGLSHNIESYLKTLSINKQKFAHEICIYPGVEIATDFLPNSNKSGATEDRLSDKLEFFSLLLIEGWFISDPVQSALNLKEYINMLGLNHITVGIAHLDYSSLSINIFKTLIENGIAIEFNDDKFSINTQNAFLALYRHCEEDIKEHLKILIGTDAHMRDHVGYHPEIDNFIFDNELQDHIIIPEEAPLFHI